MGGGGQTKKDHLEKPLEEEFKTTKHLSNDECLDSIIFHFLVESTFFLDLKAENIS